MSSEQKSRLAYFPINLFGAVMGFSGLTLGLLEASKLNWLSSNAFVISALVTSALFILISFLYLIKILRFPEEVKHDLDHPVAINFFPAFSISLLLISLIIGEISHTVASIMWHVGSVLHLVLTLIILSNWMHHEKWMITHVSPAWFIPVVGNILIPLGAVRFSSPEIGWFFFSIGLLFWLVLFTIVLYRLFFHPPMLKLLEPTLFILIAPPAVGFLAYLILNDGQMDNFARILFYSALFMTLLLLTQLPRFIKIPFALSWWAYSFPLAAIALASFKMFEHSGLTFFAVCAGALLAALLLLVVLLSFKTAVAVRNGKLCQPHPKMAQPPTAALSEK
ncbi:SLAC1 anion channel family protein [Thiomicrorhabdus xiamenensis]|uniref:C4-dicarboxylate ABC transporter n=1 Tax=Thiomicrorhabdus xiamenensis TaxID=2739063 RepID=A0A7D4NR98_9GAMM|nr:SLAC1 anion channel family protein [Thiomicrorhabdus xiamenensis]QKI89177.1 C4-dicarboxylate ABC transporter [Thiomicrorhabdus xiamenensis]